MVTKLTFIKNTNAFLAFTQIVHAYASFYDSKKSLKEFDSETSFKQNIIDKIRYQEMDYCATVPHCGLTSSSVGELTSLVDGSFRALKQKKIDDMISKEKHFKKLKHDFQFDFYNDFNEMSLLLDEHIKNIHKKHYVKQVRSEKLIALSSRFNSFLNRTFLAGNESPFYHLFSNMCSSIKVEFDIMTIERLSIFYNENKSFKETEIVYLSEILKQTVDLISSNNINHFRDHDRKNYDNETLIINRVIKKNHRLKYDYDFTVSIS